MNKTKDKNIKTFLGMPMRWEIKNVFRNLWNQKDDRIFPPKYFGIGWNLNFYALLSKMKLLNQNKK